jgi:uncharacterized protein YndB with AHSA1/START domain
MEMGIRIRARREHVYEAWADPEKISQWFTDRAEGVARTGATITWIFDQFGYVIPYHVVDATPGDRFAIGGQLKDRPPFLLEVTLEQEGGETVVHLVNSGFLEGGTFDEEYEGVRSGWALSLELLKIYVESHYGEPKRALFVMREAVFRFEDLTRFYTTASGLEAWLAQEAEVDGPSLRLSLQEGGALTGRRLVATAREAAFTWNELPGVLELKAFAMGPAGRRLGVRVVAWGGALERLAALQGPFERALERLAAALLAVPATA